MSAQCLQLNPKLRPDLTHVLHSGIFEKNFSMNIYFMSSNENFKYAGSVEKENFVGVSCSDVTAHLRLNALRYFL